MGRKTAPTLDERDEQQELLNHLHVLGLRDVAGYRVWCDQHGLSRKLAKDDRQRARELLIVKEGLIRQRLVSKKQETRKPVDLFAEICAGTRKDSDVSQPHLKRLCQAIAADRAPGDPRHSEKNLLRLLQHLHAQRANLFDDSQAAPEFGRQAGNTFIEALVLVAAYHAAWIRPLETWKPRTHNARRQFASLLRHLFAKYNDMPLFFDSAWFNGRRPDSAQERQWYLHVGAGESIRFCRLPITLNKRMAHNFMHAPHDLSVAKALRWGQTLGLGGDEHLARAVVNCRLGVSFEHDELWKTVIEWFVANPMLDREHVGPIVDYLQTQRFEPNYEHTLTERRRELPPSQPNLTMKGRSAESLLRKVDEWHRALARDNTHQIGQWNSVGIPTFELVEGSQTNDTLKLWTIRELLSSKALATEGRQLRHCVASYARSCAHGQCSIWTLEVADKEGKTKLLTIELRNPRRLICQARGKLNRPATEKERSIIRRWAAQAGLTLATYV